MDNIKLIDDQSVVMDVTMDTSNSANEIKTEPKDDSDYEEIIEETLVHVVMDNPEDMSTLNPSSNVRVIAIDSDSPALQIENKLFHLNEWKHIQGTAMFFEQKKEKKNIDPLYDNRCGSDLQFIGSTRKCLEMTKKETSM